MSIQFRNSAAFDQRIEFYEEWMDWIWILSSNEFLKESHHNKEGKNAGKRSIWFNGKSTKAQIEHVKPQFEKCIATNFRRIQEEDPS